MPMPPPTPPTPERPTTMTIGELIDALGDYDRNSLVNARVFGSIFDVRGIVDESFDDLDYNQLVIELDY